MPHEIIWEERGVHKRFSGFLSFEEFARVQEEILADPRVDTLRYIINDFLAVEGYSVTREQAEYSGAINRGTSFSNARIRVACVTTDMSVRLLIIAAALFSSLEVRTFPTLDMARAWAGAPH